MKALSLWQPWASAIAVGAKRIETRGWSTSYRGLIAIHAASTKKGLAVRDPYWRVVFGASRELNDLPMGAIVAVARLCEVLPTDFVVRSVRGFTEMERKLGDYTTGRFAWVLENIYPLPCPVPCRGAQRLWELDADVEVRVRAALWPALGGQTP